MAEIAVPMLIMGTAATAGSQVMQGVEQSNAAKFEQQQLLGQQKDLQAQAQNTRIAADQAEAQRRYELTSNLEHIQSIRAGRGVGEASPTGMAILDSLTGITERNIDTERFNYLSKADTTDRAANNAGLSAAMAGRKAQTSLLAGFLGAAGTVGGAGFKYGSYSRGGGYQGAGPG